MKNNDFLYFHWRSLALSPALSGVRLALPGSLAPPGFLLLPFVSVALPGASWLPGAPWRFLAHPKSLVLHGPVEPQRKVSQYYGAQK